MKPLLNQRPSSTHKPQKHPLPSNSSNKRFIRLQEQSSFAFIAFLHFEFDTTPRPIPILYLFRRSSVKPLSIGMLLKRIYKGQNRARLQLQSKANHKESSQGRSEVEGRDNKILSNRNFGTKSKLDPAVLHGAPVIFFFSNCRSSLWTSPLHCFLFWLPSIGPVFLYFTTTFFSLFEVLKVSWK